MEENTKICPACGGSVPVDAETCSFCGADLKENSAVPVGTEEAAETVAAMTEAAETAAPAVDAEAIPEDFPDADTEEAKTSSSIPAYIPKPVTHSAFDLPDVKPDVNVQVPGTAKTSTSNSSKVWLWIAIGVVALIAICICCIAGLFFVGLVASN